jgi:predicted nuclease of predicted toxin-antitoxin system
MEFLKSLNFVADESVERPVYLALGQLGHEVWDICTHASGVSDREVLALARQRNAILLTADKDFGDLVYIDLEEVRGVVLLRLQGMPLRAIVGRAVAAIEAHIHELDRHFLVVTSRQVRVRPLLISKDGQPASG